MLRYFYFDFGHTSEITEEIGSLHLFRVDAFVTEFAEKTAVAHVGTQVYLPEVLEPVVGGDAVDMVDGHAGFDRSDKGYMDGVRDEDGFFVPKGVWEE